MESKVRTVRIAVSFGRKVNIAFQGWDFVISLAEDCEVVSDEDISRQRRKLRLRAVASVYSDILNDYSRILESLPSNKPDYVAQMEHLKIEAETALKDSLNQLKELA